MRRFHLFEFGDQKWVPKIFREYLHELLQYQVGKIYAPLFPTLMTWLKNNKIEKLTDLASGTGGPWAHFIRRVQAEVPMFELQLSDINPQALKELSYKKEPVDLRNSSTWPEGSLTVFTGFHHLKPHEAMSFLKAVSVGNRSIFIAEFTERKLSKVLGMILAPIVVFVDTLLVRPVSLLRLFFTYIVPVVPLMYTWDGAVSHLRTYSIKELQKMLEKLDTDGPTFEFFEVKNEKYGIKLTGCYSIGRRSSDEGKSK